MKNNEQPSLFGSPNQYGGYEDKPIARATDPQTSHDAAAQHTKGGRRQANADIVLAIVKRLPGSTYREIYAACTDDERAALGESGAVEVQRRLNDLRHDGKVRDGPARACRVNGNKMQTWIAS